MSLGGIHPGGVKVKHGYETPPPTPPTPEEELWYGVHACRVGRRQERSCEC